MSIKIPILPQLLKNYPRKEDLNHVALFNQLGWSDIIDHKGYENTCAIRMSLCLIRCGMSIGKISNGCLKIKDGDHKDEWIETRQTTLSQYLKKIWGEPTSTTSVAAVAKRKVGTGGGVISFNKIPGYTGGRTHRHYRWEPICTEQNLGFGGW